MPDDPYAIAWAEAVPRLTASAVAEASWSAAVADDLVLATDRLAVDLGCGAGGMTRALAGAMADGRAVGVDSSPEVLDAARAASDGVPLAEYALAELGPDVGPLREILGGPADLVWASAALHHAGDQQAVLDALAGLLAPGGRVALAEGGLPMRHMPWDLGVGDPGLETRLEAARDRWFAGMRAALPRSVRMPYGWTEALRRAGLVGVTTRTWLLETTPPLPPEDRERIAAGFAHRVERLGGLGLLDAGDRAAWARLLDRDGPDWLGAREDLYRLSGRSVHIGRRG